MAVGTMNLKRYLIWQSDWDLTVFLGFTGMTLISGAAFIINQIKDREGDSINQKLFLVGNHISPERAEFLQRIIAVFGLILLLFTGILPLFFGLILYLFWGILYNIQPFHWKQKAILGMIVNTIAGFVLYLTGWAIVNTNSLELSKILHIIKYSFPYLLCYTSVSLLTTIPDIKGDNETGSETFPIKFGRIPTMIISTALVIFASYLGFIWDDPISSTAALISIPFYIFMVLRRSPVDVLRTIRFSIFNLAFFLMAVYPFLFVASFINFYLSKYYYWHRFNLHYPTFLVEK